MSAAPPRRADDATRALPWADPVAESAAPQPAGAGLPDLHALAADLPPGWRPTVQAFLAGPEGRALAAFLATERASGARIYPPDPLRALRLTAPEAVRVVILGQDPYHGPGQAEGLAFSVAPGLPHPPSLRNLLGERARDLGLPPPRSGSLVAWAGRGVLLLNTTLTVRDGEPASHAGQGWEALSAALLDQVAADPSPKVFMLWGAHAQRLGERIARAGPGHLRLEANHPSPLSARRPPRPFLGCGHFGLAQAWLQARGRPLAGGWTLPGDPAAAAPEDAPEKPCGAQ